MTSDKSLKARVASDDFLPNKVIALRPDPDPQSRILLPFSISKVFINDNPIGFVIFSSF